MTKSYPRYNRKEHLKHNNEEIISKKENKKKKAHTRTHTLSKWFCLKESNAYSTESNKQNPISNKLKKQHRLHF